MLTVNTGGQAFATSDISINEGGQAIVNGAPEAEYGDELNPGNSPGTLYIEEGYEQDSLASLIIELAGYEQGLSFDLLDIGGYAMLDGTLQVKLLDSFMPQIGDSFEIIRAGDDISGEFSFLSLSELSAGMEWVIGYNVPNGFDDKPNNVLLSVQASVVPIPGATWLLGWMRRKQVELRITAAGLMR